jgi:hypothetical protein
MRDDPWDADWDGDSKRQANNGAKPSTDGWDTEWSDWNVSPQPSPTVRKQASKKD